MATEDQVCHILPRSMDAAEVPPITKLPTEILVEIFSYLPLVDIAHCTCVCRKWGDILKRQKSVWRRKEYLSRKKCNKDEVLVIAKSMPQLTCLHILYDKEFGIHISWPEAAVSFCYDGKSRLLRKVPVPYFIEFDTKNLVVCEAVFQVCFKWVKRQTLQTIYIADQCEGAGTNPTSPFYYYGKRKHCFGPTCSYRGIQPMFCTLCTYSHHWNCPGKGCPLKSSAYEQVNLWCHPEPPSSGAALNFQQWCLTDESHSGLSIDDEIENALCRPTQCMSLEKAIVSSARFAPIDLRFLCTMGRLRVLRFESASLRSLSFMQLCRSSLEELTVLDCTWLPAESFKEFRRLKRLKVLRLAKYRATPSAIKKYTKHLHGLDCVLQKPLDHSVAALLPPHPADFLLE